MLCFLRKVENLQKLGKICICLRLAWSVLQNTLFSREDVQCEAKNTIRNDNLLPNELSQKNPSGDCQVMNT